MAKEEKLKALHTAELDIGGIQVTCHVLSNGERLLSTAGMFAALDRPRRGRRVIDAQNLPTFMASNNLVPFVPEELYETSTPLKFETEAGFIAEGFRADILPLVCETYLSARDAQVLTYAQKQTAQRCEIIIRALSRVGIVALIDEVTGYQAQRPLDALRLILETYISKELSKWVKTFPDEFYQQMFRLRGWSLDNINSRPSVVGSYTNDLVYKRLAPCILRELENHNPKNEIGIRKYRHHQWLTETGHPRLKEHLNAVIALMRISKNWTVFMAHMDQAFPKYGDTIPFDFFIDED